jgi:hypothetical protein
MSFLKINSKIRVMALNMIEQEQLVSLVFRL